MYVAEAEEGIVGIPGILEVPEVEVTVRVRVQVRHSVSAIGPTSYVRCAVLSTKEGLRSPLYLLSRV